MRSDSLKGTLAIHALEPQRSGSCIGHSGTRETSLRHLRHMRSGSACSGDDNAPAFAKCTLTVLVLETRRVDMCSDDTFSGVTALRQYPKALRQYMFLTVCSDNTCLGVTVFWQYPKAL
ncbi:hypothetical protein AMTR_s00009p00242370 [Amborella trichopoda]|uniref:Uncharacterized protein n=1 Tax=Amborella trichopoda TaxID=13333 RepID=W1NHQ7_AMBTC|nr:hypothetical protein AMTR_s00009p00242370 [Amborella trichopoda]